MPALPIRQDISPEDLCRHALQTGRPGECPADRACCTRLRE